MDRITPGMTYGLALLAVGAYSIPLLLIGWLWFRTPIRRTWVPLLFFVGRRALQNRRGVFVLRRVGFSNRPLFHFGRSSAVAQERLVQLVWLASPRGICRGAH
jgi:hypothetical protein